MSSLAKIKGNYYLQFYDSDRSPTRKKVALGTKSKRTAEKLQRRYDDAYALGDYDPWSGRTLGEPTEDMDVSEALQAFLEAKHREGCAHSTIRNYRSTVERAFSPSLPVRSLSERDCEPFIYDDSVSAATRGGRFRHIRAFVNWCESEGLRSRGLDLKKPKQQEKLPKAVREEELDAIIAAIRKDHAEKRKYLKNGGDIVWRIPLFRFALLTGLRGSELARLRWEHVRLERGEMVIEEQKNGRATVLPLSAKAVDVLRGIGHREGWVFCGPGEEHSTRSTVTFRDNQSSKFREYRRAAGVREEVSFHGLRHGFATRLAEAGCNAATIKRLMRHSSIQTSMKYIHMAGSGLRDSLDQAFG